METVNKKDLAERIAATSGVSVATVVKVLNGAIEEVQGAVTAGERVALAGFGTFKGSERAARLGRNPQTGAEIPVAACTTPVFKAAEAFKTRVKTAAAERAV